jgi:putative transposase
MEPGQLYHIYSHANGSENFFRSTENYQYFLKQYQKHILHVADTLVYCLMPNHFHFLVRLNNSSGAPNPKESGDSVKNKRKVSQPFSNLFNAYTKAYNLMYSRMGSLFVPNFKRKPIQSDLHLTRVILYIHLNPVHHCFAKTPEAWLWSSYKTMLSQRETWIKRDEVIRWFGNKNEFIRMHNQFTEEDDIEEFLL